MSAFDRHPRRAAYEAMAERLSYFDPAIRRVVRRSPQNRNVRFLADLEAARLKDFSKAETRQQFRWHEQQRWNWAAKRRSA